MNGRVAVKKSDTRQDVILLIYIDIKIIPARDPNQYAVGTLKEKAERT